MPAPNRMVRLLERLHFLPPPLRRAAQTLLLGRAVPFVGTARLAVDEVTQQRVVVRIRNRRRVQNHIRGVHAAAMALLAETATGFAVGMHVPDGRIPLIRTLRLDYVRRARGDLRAVVELRDDQIAAIHGTERGEIAVPVTVTDASGESPIVCEAVWAWVPRRAAAQ